MEEKKKTSCNVVIVIVLMLMVLGLGGYITYDKVLSDDTDIVEDCKNSVETKAILNIENPNSYFYNAETAKDTLKFMIGKYELDKNNYFELKENGDYLLHVQTGEEGYFNYNSNDSKLIVHLLYDGDELNYIQIQLTEIAETNEDDQYKDTYLFTTGEDKDFTRYALMNFKPIADPFEYKWIKVN